MVSTAAEFKAPTTAVPSAARMTAARTPFTERALPCLRPTPQMIQPPPTLKDRLPMRSVDPHMLDRAEQALQELVGGYITQMGEEISEMARVVKTAREPGTDGVGAADRDHGGARNQGPSAIPFSARSWGRSTLSCAIAANWMLAVSRLSMPTLAWRGADRGRGRHQGQWRRCRRPIVGCAEHAGRRGATRIASERGLPSPLPHRVARSVAPPIDYAHERAHCQAFGAGGAVFAPRG